MLIQVLGRPLGIAESYPDLKACAKLRQLQEELARTEDMMASSRAHNNAAVRDRDTARLAFPTSVSASMYEFEDRGYFEVETVKVRQATKVSFE